MRPNLNALVNYVTVPTARRRNQAQRARIQAESEYSPATDFWKRLRTAVRWDRATTRDGAAMHDVAEEATARKRTSHHIVAEAWPAIALRWESAVTTKSPAKDLSVGGLTINVRPLFSELMADGTIEHVAVWMNQVEPTMEAIRGALRLLTLIDDRPNVRAVFIDARRGAVHVGTSESLRHIDRSLVLTCASFVHDAA